MLCECMWKMTNVLKPTLNFGWVGEGGCKQYKLIWLFFLPLRPFSWMKIGSYFKSARDEPQHLPDARCHCFLCHYPLFIRSTTPSTLVCHWINHRSFMFRSIKTHPVWSVYIWPLTQEKGHHIVMAVGRGQMETRPSSLVFGLKLCGWFTEEQANHSSESTPGS